MLCGANGLVYDFILYQGSTTELNPIYSKCLGEGAAIVMQLSERITEPFVYL